jgi:YD repeat-containing protein
LNISGVIVQQTRGLPDDHDYGMMHAQLEYVNTRVFENRNIPERANYLLRTKKRRADFQHDIFAYNFLGRTGSFYINDQGECIELSKTGLRLSKIVGSSGKISSFTIEDENGFNYQFSIREESISDGPGTLPAVGDTYVGASWYLSKIISAKGNIVDFHYKQSFLEYKAQQESVTFSAYPTLVVPCVCMAPSTNTYAIKTKIPNYLLTEVVFAEGKVVLTSATARNDIKALQMYTGSSVNISPALDKIEILNKSNETLKSIEFTYDNNERLMLKEVNEKPVGNVPGAQNSVHKLQYYGGAAMPSLDRMSNDYKKQDHWGYYNGIANQTLIPTFNFLTYDAGGWGIRAGANRASKGEASILGMLKSIQYPTGGTASFEYEPNSISFPNVSSVPEEYQGSIEIKGTPQTLIERHYSNSANDSFSLSGFSNLMFTEMWVYNVGDPPPSIHHNTLYITLPEITEFSFEMSPGVMYLERTYKRTNVANGTYNFDVNTTGYNQQLDFVINYTPGQNPALPVKIEVGGHRVKKVTQNDGHNTVSYKQYVYSDFEFVGDPDYASYQDYWSQNGACNINCPRTTTIGSSNTNYNGGPVMKFRNIIEQSGENNSIGEVKYRFSPSKIERIGLGRYYDIDLGNAQAGGKLISKEYFEKLGNGNLRIKAKEFSNYDIHEFEAADNTNYLYSLINEWSNVIYPPNGDEFGIGASMVNEFLNGAKLFKYRLSSYTAKLKDEGRVEYFYENSNLVPIDSIVSKKAFFYLGANLTFPSKIQEYNSKQKLVLNEFKYPQDLTFSDPVAENARVKMIQRNIIAPSLIHSKSVDGLKIAEKTVLFKEWSNGLLLPSSDETVYNNSGNSNDKLSVYFKRYDLKGNLLQQAQKDNVNYSYIWDVNANLSASVINSSVNDIAYSSFELIDNDSWITTGTQRYTSDAITGTQCYSLNSGSISKSGLTALMKYVVSYWVKTGASVTISGGVVGTPVAIRSYNGWTMYEQTLTGASTVTVLGTGLIDELRLYPIDAQMTTYTHKPLIGITSQTDAKGQTIYYEYDEFQRLKNVKDQNGNIIKNNIYHYKP